MLLSSFFFFSSSKKRCLISPPLSFFFSFLFLPAHRLCLRLLPLPLSGFRKKNKKRKTAREGGDMLSNILDVIEREAMKREKRGTAPNCINRRSLLLDYRLPTFRPPSPLSFVFWGARYTSYNPFFPHPVLKYFLFFCLLTSFLEGHWLLFTYILRDG